MTVATSAVVGVAVAVAAKDSAGFAYGVASGEVTPTSAKLWTRAPSAGTVTLTVVEATKKPTVRTFTLRAVAGQRPDGAARRHRPRAVDRVSLHVCAAGLGRRQCTGVVPDRAEGEHECEGAVRHLRRRRRNTRAEWEAGLQQLRDVRPDGRRAQRLQHQPRGHDLLGQRSRRCQAGADRPREVGEVQARAGTPGAAATPGGREPGQPARRPRVHQRLLGAGVRQAALSRGREGVHRLRAGLVEARERVLPHLPLGQEPRALRARRAFVPQRQGREAVRQRPRADGPGCRASGVRDTRTVACQPGPTGVPHRDQRSVPDDARRGSGAAVPRRDQGLERDLQGHRQRGADPAVLPAALRPLGGLRSSSHSAPQGPRWCRERRLPDHGHAREHVRRGSTADPRRATDRNRDLGGGDRPGRDEHVRQGDRHRDRHEGNGRLHHLPLPQAHAARGYRHALRRDRRVQLQPGRRHR